MATATNVTTGKPKVGGAVYRAPSGTTLPTDATTALSSTFVSLGYVDENGLTNSNGITVESIKAWGGDTVLTSQTEKEDKFKFNMIETMNSDVLKTIYGESNVTVASSGAITVTADATEHTAYVWVFELVLRGGIAKRIVVPSATVTEIGDITYKDNQAVAFETTITCVPDASGNTHYEYINTSV